MAVLYVFPAGEYVQINDQNNNYLTSIHASELSFGLDANGNVQFSHRRDTAQLFPIQATTFSEVLDQSGTPYSTIDVDDFVAVFSLLPKTGSAGGGGASGGAVALNQKVIAGATTFLTSVLAKEVQIIALSATFSVTDTSGSANVTIYPLSTVGGGLIESFSLKAPEGGVIQPLSITVPIGGSILYLEKL
jgi:hypothetical protein